MLPVIQRRSSAGVSLCSINAARNSAPAFGRRLAVLDQCCQHLRRRRPAATLAASWLAFRLSRLGE
jgi:hypothetical protein